MAYKNKDDAKRWYQENRDQEIERAKARNAEYKKRNREYVIQIKSQGACADCGLRPEVLEVLEFDHTGNDKEHDVARLVHRGSSLKQLQKEIEKCELVCANCHRVRTVRRRMDVV